MTITEEDIVKIADHCRELPETDSVYLATDFVSCIDHFVNCRWDEIRTLRDLQVVLASYPDDKDGNTALAEYLWGYKLWTRARMLRGLVAMFASRGIDNLASLRAWATSSSFKADFEGRVPGLGPTVYNWLVMRLGVETVKPDVHILRFVNTTLGKRVNESDAVTVVCEDARRLGLRTYELDWRMWNTKALFDRYLLEATDLQHSSNISCVPKRQSRAPHGRCAVRGLRTTSIRDRRSTRGRRDSRREGPQVNRVDDLATAS